MQYRDILPKRLIDPDPNIYLSNNYLVLDFECTNIDYADPINLTNHIVLSCWYYNTNKYIYDSEYNQQALLKDIYTADFIVCHNCKFELGWLKRCGLDLETIVCWCTQIGEYTIHGNIKVPLTLDATAIRYGIGSKNNFVSTLIQSGICPSTIPENPLIEYCTQDVNLTNKLFLKQRQKIFELGLAKVVYTRNLLTPVLADIEFNGMQLDKDKVKELYKETTKELKYVEQELAGITGGINPRSPKQMAEFIFTTLGFAEPKNWKGNPIRTATGNKSVSTEIIAALSGTNKRQREFLRVKKLQQSLQQRISKYLEKMYACCNESDGILFGNFNQTLTQTGRLSSNGKRYKIQFQNIAREFKPLFKCRKSGTTLQERDYRQLEFRCAGELTGDPQISADVEKNADIHKYTAMCLTGHADPSDEERQAAKSRTFKPLYGGISGTNAEREYYQAFRDKYNVLTSEQDKWVDIAYKTKKLRTCTGLIFYFPDLKILKSGYILGNTKVRDYPIQYFATGEIVPIGLIFFWHLLKALKLKTFIINTVHDSVLNEVFEDEKELVNTIAVQALQDFPVKYMDKLYGIKLTLPLEVELKEGTHWK